MSPDPRQQLLDDMYALYHRTGEVVSYVPEGHSERRRYFPKRFLQSIRKADNAGDDAGVQLATRMVEGDPTRGFGYLAPDYLDLSVEWLVSDPDRPYHGLFSQATIETARARLREFGAVPPGGEREPGSSHELRLLLHPDGSSTLMEPWAKAVKWETPAQTLVGLNAVVARAYGTLGVEL